jgi:ATP-dependent RNA helicase DOB1
MEVDEDAYVDQFKPFLMDVVHEWCKGASFSKLCEMTDIFEGMYISTNGSIRFYSETFISNIF